VMSQPLENGIIITKCAKALRKYTQLWELEWERQRQEWEIQNLRYFIYNIWNFDIDGKKNAIEALASYKRNALPVLVELSTSLMNKDLRDLAFEKIKQINEGR
jgi:hypothetical protein